jgi:hypothetical protein
MKITNNKWGFVLPVLLLGLAFSTNSTAAWIGCPSPVNSDNIQANAGCQYSDSLDQDDTTPPLTVNTDGGMHSFTDWIFGGKEEWNNIDAFDIHENGSPDIGLNITADNQLSGDWSINDVWGDYEDIALVFKDGRNTTLVSYLLVDGDTSGTWDSPFTNPPFTNLQDGQIKGVSHVSAYMRIGDGGGTPPFAVPEPGIVALFSLGLLGMGLSRTRGNRKVM